MLPRGSSSTRPRLRAEAVRVCARCKRPIVDQYFESVGTIVCQRCADLLGAGVVGGGAFRRALGYGVGASLLGTIVWYGFTKLTGSELGIIAIAVGLLVGIAVRRGSGGQGGWKYQALAMALTYVSITSSYVPDVLTGFANGAEHRKQEAAKKSEASGAPSEGVKVSEAPSTKATAAAVVARCRVRVRCCAGSSVPRWSGEHHGPHHHRHRAVRGLEDQPPGAAYRAISDRCPSASATYRGRPARFFGVSPDASVAAVRVCASCGAELPASLLACPGCRTLVHAADVEDPSCRSGGCGARR